MFATMLVEPAQHGAGKFVISHVELLRIGLNHSVWGARCSHGLRIALDAGLQAFRAIDKMDSHLRGNDRFSSFLIVLISLAAEQAPQAIFHTFIIIAAQPLAGSLLQLTLFFFQALFGPSFFFFKPLLRTGPLFLQLLSVALLQLVFGVFRYQTLYALTVKPAIAKRADLGQRTATAQQRQAAIYPVVARHLAPLGAGGLAAQA